jgi:two-component system response regulator AtoC
MKSPETKPVILVAEDELEVREYLDMALRCLGYEVEFAQDGLEVMEFLNANPRRASLVLLDVVMPHQDGLETLQKIRRITPELPVIMVSGVLSTLNVASMKAGVASFLSKPVSHDDLREAIEKALRNQPAATPTLPSVREPLPVVPRSFLGNSREIRDIQSQIPRIGWSEAPVLIQGETGSGKEVLARELHASSPRAGKVFLKLNCAALPSELVESELFGYERGAFTGAFQKKAGMFELADGGTLLLDEIGDMDVRLQAKLLQVLQDHEFQRIGGKDVVRVNVRVIAATHRNLEQAIANRTFREDLYYRLDVITLHVPPLRKRPDDILILAHHLLKKHSTPGVPLPELTPELQNAMLGYDWPGNVRELENTARKLIILRDSEGLARELRMRSARRPVYAEALPERLGSAVSATDSSPILEQVTKAKHQAESEAIRAALQSTHWNRKQAAALLKIDYKALLYKMKKLGIEDKLVSFVPASLDRRAKVAQAGGNGD